MLNTKFNERPLRAGIITPLAYSLNLGDTEGVFSASITVPDEALSVKQLLDRFTSGVELPPIQKPAYYEDSQDFDSYDVTKDPAFDLADATSALHELSNREIPAPAPVPPVSDPVPDPVPET